MSYFFYVPTTNMPQNYVPEEFQNFCPPSTPEVVNNGFGQKIYYAPTFPSSQWNFTEYSGYGTQQDFMLPSFQSLQQLQHENLEVREPKKRQRKSEKQIESAKKNSQSNLINHFFSFFNSREKSEKTVEFTIQSLNKVEAYKEKLVHLFYNTIHVINARRGRKYVNRKILASLFQPQELVKAIPQIKQKIQKFTEITLEELCQIFRKCCYSFYRTYSIDSILTSKRISSVAREEHFRKRRKVVKSFSENE